MYTIDSLEFRFESKSLCALLSPNFLPDDVVLKDKIILSFDNIEQEISYKLVYLGKLPKYNFYGQIVINGLPLCNIYAYPPFDDTDTSRVWISFQSTNYNLYDNYLFSINFLDYFLKKFDAQNFVFRKIDVCVDSPAIKEYACFFKDKIAGNELSRRLGNQSKIDLSLFFPKNTFTGLLSCKKSKSTPCQMSIYNKSLDIKETGKQYIQDWHQSLGYSSSEVWRCEYRFSSYFFDKKAIKYNDELYTFSFDLLFDKDFLCQTLIKFGNFYHTYYFETDNTKRQKQDKQAIDTVTYNLFSFCNVDNNIVQNVQNKPFHSNKTTPLVSKNYIKSLLRGSFGHFFYSRIKSDIEYNHSLNDYIEGYFLFVKHHFDTSALQFLAKSIDFNLSTYLKKRLPTWYKKHVEYYLYHNKIQDNKNFCNVFDPDLFAKKYEDAFLYVPF